jgi:aldehyde dehydrogenase (NAD+)
VVPALLVGCTCILKPSELAPLSSLLFAEMIDEAGFPPGVFNLINGDGDGVGTQLSRHPDVDMVSFTGSTRAGASITKNAADSFKRVKLELGGKGANLIFADAPDLEETIEAGVYACFLNSGQTCDAPTRMLVERSVYNRAVEIAQQVAESIIVQSAHLEGDHLGPLVSAGHFQKVQNYIRTGIEKDGARLVAGGLGRPEGTTNNNANDGFYTKPTVFADVHNRMTIMREEIFGPVLCIMPFDTEEEALAIANDTPYGLTNCVHTQDGRRRNRLARALRSGMVEMNGMGGDSGSPFGGMKASGNAREGGVWGLEEFCEVKAVTGWTDEEDDENEDDS